MFYPCAKFRCDTSTNKDDTRGADDASPAPQKTLNMSKKAPSDWG